MASKPPQCVLALVVRSCSRSALRRAAGSMRASATAARSSQTSPGERRVRRRGAGRRQTRRRRFTLTGGPRSAPAGVLVRYLRSGRLDPAFGDGGVVTWRIPAASVESMVRGLVIQPDGKIVAAGEARGARRDGTRLRARAAIARTVSGMLVVAFDQSGWEAEGGELRGRVLRSRRHARSRVGNGGRVVTDFGADDAARAVTLRDGRDRRGGCRR